MKLQRAFQLMWLNCKVKNSLRGSQPVITRRKWNTFVQKKNHVSNSHKQIKEWDGRPLPTSFLPSVTPSHRNVLVWPFLTHCWKEKRVPEQKLLEYQNGNPSSDYINNQILPELRTEFSVVFPEWLMLHPLSIGHLGWSATSLCLVGHTSVVPFASGPQNRAFQTCLFLVWLKRCFLPLSADVPFWEHSADTCSQFMYIFQTPEFKTCHHQCFLLPQCYLPASCSPALEVISF